MSSPGYRRDSKCSCFWECIVPVTRFWGVATAVVLGGVGADVTVHGHVMGIYIIIAAIGVFFLEIVWAVTLFLQLCIRNDESAFFRCWEAILWINGWKKTIIYGALAVAPILWPNKLWLSYVAGGQLIVLALLHLVLVFRKRRGRARKKDSLLSYGDGDSLESCKFEDVLDDTMPGPIPVESHSLADSLPGDQDAILEI